MNMLKKSIWIFHLNTGGCNGCDIEILDILTPYHDAERFGVRLVGSPRHADILLLTGPITRQNLDKVIDAIEATPEPKYIIAIGSCACGGGIWYDSFSVIGGVTNLIKIMKARGLKIPKVIYVPGCPPKPEAILHAIAYFKGIVSKKIHKVEYAEK